jgi:UTP--glucose-1-phosphate uridylyltransferase
MTSVLPKSMLPVVDLPVVYYLVDEAARSGITDVLIIVGEKDSSIPRFLSQSSELADELIRSGNESVLERLSEISRTVNISYAYQEEASGLADAVALGEDFVADEPFCVLYGDDLILSDEPVCAQLISVYEKYGAAVLGVQSVPCGKLSDYCSLKVAEPRIEDGLYRCLDIIEKPARGEEYSSLAVLGRLVLTKDVFDGIKGLRKGRSGEHQLTDAVAELASRATVLAKEFSGARYDLGSKAGFVKANIAAGLLREEIKDELKEFLKELIKEWI